MSLRFYIMEKGRILDKISSVIVLVTKLDRPFVFL